MNDIEIYSSKDGDIKIAYGTESQLIKFFKFPSVVGRTKVNPNINDNRVYKYKDNYYYLGDDALLLESNKIIDITSYDKLEYYAPLFLYHVCNILQETPDIIVTGLSKAQITNSGHFEEVLKKFTVNDKEYTFDNVFILPQGAGSKLTIDKYDDNFPNESKTFNSNKSYISIDIGFNTLDLFQVMNGKTGSNLFEGIENQGIVRLATKVKDEIKSKYERDITLKEAKQVLDTNTFKLRGAEHNMSEFNKKIKLEYLTELNNLVENRYGNILDKMDNFYLLGGGSYVFTDIRDRFYKVPHKDNEYYNALGFYLYGVNKVKVN